MANLGIYRRYLLSTLADTDPSRITKLINPNCVTDEIIAGKQIYLRF